MPPGCASRAPFAETAAWKVARQKVHVREGQASYLILPVIPPGD